MKSTTAVLAVAAVAVLALAPHADAFGCKPDEVKGWIKACDSVTASTQAKCDNRQCHTALHRLVEQETADCYQSSGLGQGTDLLIYHEIDTFCHGEGPDPGPKTLPPFTSAPPPTTAPIVTQPPAPTTVNPGPGPAPTTVNPGPGPAPTTSSPDPTKPGTPTVTPAPPQAC